MTFHSFHPFPTPPTTLQSILRLIIYMWFFCNFSLWFFFVCKFTYSILRLTGYFNFLLCLKPKFKPPLIKDRLLKILDVLLTVKGLLEPPLLWRHDELWRQSCMTSTSTCRWLLIFCLIAYHSLVHSFIRS